MSYAEKNCRKNETGAIGNQLTNAPPREGKHCGAK